MTWHVSEIAIYNGSAVRRLPFRPGMLNLVTGCQQKGKSTLLEILDYCLLSKGCRIPKGAVRDAVEAVGVLLTSGTETLGLVRRLPGSGKASVHACWLALGGKALPEEIPNDNHSTKTAKEGVSGFTGVEFVDVLATESEQSNAVVNVRHCSPFLFQHQDVIANRNVSFAGLGDFWVRRHTVDAIGYFLGCLTIDFLQERDGLVQLRSEVAALRRQEAEASRLSSRGFQRGAALWVAARSLELVRGEQPESLARLHHALERVLSWKGSAIADMAGQLGGVEERERELVRDLGALRRERDAVRHYLKVTGDSARAAAGGLERVAVSKLLPQPKDDVCPMCKGQLPSADWEHHLSLASSALERETKVDPRVGSKLQRHLTDISAKHEKLSATLGTSRRRIHDLRKRIAGESTEAELTGQRLRVVGRVDEYLRAMAGALEPVVSDLTELSQELGRLEASVGDAVLRERLKTAEERISFWASKYADSLQTEFSGSPVRLRLRDLVIQVKVDGRWTSLSELGSGANWVSYHVACTLGLHHAFQEGGGPVPRVVLLDQPSQAWFPPERVAVDGGLEPRSDADRGAVRRLYSAVHEFCTATGIQVIIVDHARPDLPWIEDSIVEDWHGDKGLVPAEWIDA